MIEKIKKITFIIQNSNEHVSIDTVKEFQEIISRDKEVLKKTQYNKYISKLIYKLSSIINLQLIITGKKNKKLFTILMGDQYHKCFPFFLSQNENSIYMFDAWPNQHKKILNFVIKYKIKNVFFSSSQVTDIFNNKKLKANFYWIPEAIKVDEYQFEDYENKKIDVLCLGRKYDSYHNDILNILKNENKIYLFEKEKGKLIFPSRASFIKGLASAKISICVPSSITHPGKSGIIETMTMRYLQSMISKCLILGHAPKEMIELFGYNPVIEIDKIKPQSQIINILNNFENYIPLIEKNYNNVIENHTWNNRWTSIKEKLY